MNNKPQTHALALSAFQLKALNQAHVEQRYTHPLQYLAAVKADDMLNAYRDAFEAAVEDLNNSDGTPTEKGYAHDAKEYVQKLSKEDLPSEMVYLIDLHIAITRIVVSAQYRFNPKPFGVLKYFELLDREIVERVEAFEQPFYELYEAAGGFVNTPPSREQMLRQRDYAGAARRYADAPAERPRNMAAERAARENFRSNSGYSPARYPSASRDTSVDTLALEAVKDGTSLNEFLDGVRRVNLEPMRAAYEKAKMLHAMEAADDIKGAAVNPFGVAVPDLSVESNLKNYAAQMASLAYLHHMSLVMFLAHFTPEHQETMREAYIKEHDLSDVDRHERDRERVRQKDEAPVRISKASAKYLATAAVKQGVPMEEFLKDVNPRDMDLMRCAYMGANFI
jgi:hypothetical protein